jgi:signal transduction histidine kinase
MDPFITSKPGADAGLGLSAAWGIVRRHGGELSLGPGAEGGTVATLKVPLSPPET